MQFISKCLTVALLCVPGSLSFAAEAKDPITEYEVLFSPRDHVAEELIAHIKREKKSIRAAVYCLMHRGISKALIEAEKKGVSVELIVDPFSVKTRSPLKKMSESGIPIYVWTPTQKTANPLQKRKSLMHDKFCVFGDSKVWTGSFNFTFDATTVNCENVIVLENPQLAQQYLKEFKNLKDAGCVPYKEFLKVRKQEA
ncbi:MAG: phospholipase D-like domain-containing protein [Chlamydiota bacterium]